MSHPPVIGYLLNSAEPIPYQIFRAFIIAHDSQDLNRFHQWVDWLVGVYVPLLDVPSFILKKITRALVDAKTTPLIVNHLAMSDHFRAARILSSSSPPQTQHQKQYTWTTQAYQDQRQAQTRVSSQRSYLPAPGPPRDPRQLLGRSTAPNTGPGGPFRSGQMQGHGRGRGHGHV